MKLSQRTIDFYLLWKVVSDRILALYCKSAGNKFTPILFLEFYVDWNKIVTNIYHHVPLVLTLKVRFKRLCNALLAWLLSDRLLDKSIQTSVVGGDISNRSSLCLSINIQTALSLTKNKNPCTPSWKNCRFEPNTPKTVSKPKESRILRLRIHILLPHLVTYTVACTW